MIGLRSLAKTGERKVSVSRFLAAFLADLGDRGVVAYRPTARRMKDEYGDDAVSEATFRKWFHPQYGKLPTLQQLPMLGKLLDIPPQLLLWLFHLSDRLDMIEKAPERYAYLDLLQWSFTWLQGNMVIFDPFQVAVNTMMSARLHEKADVTFVTTTPKPAVFPPKVHRYVCRSGQPIPLGQGLSCADPLVIILDLLTVRFSPKDGVVLHVTYWNPNSPWNQFDLSLLTSES